MEKDFKIDFIAIGAAKSGTPWLTSCLRAHPEICLSEPKEVNYFNLHKMMSRETNENHMKPFSWYINCFRHCQEKKVKGEFSPIYFYDEKAPSLIKKCCPDVKLIVCLRNPIDRAYSKYWEMRSYKKMENRIFEDAIRENEHYIEMGFYYKQLKRYLEHFNRDQMLILLYDDIVSHSEEEARRIFRFLSVSENINIEPDLLRNKTDRVKETKFSSIIPIMNFTHRLLVDLRLGFLSLALRKIGVTRLILKLNTVTINYSEMDLKTREYLRNVFKDDIRELGILLNRDLSHWR